MKKLIVSFGIMLTTFIASAQQFREGVVLVGPKAGVTEQQLDKELAKYNTKKNKKLAHINVYEIKVPIKAEKAVVKALSNNKLIKFAELDMLIAPTYVANDTYYSQAWHIHKLNVPASWDISEGDGKIGHKL